RKLDPYVPLPGDQLRIDLVGLDWKWLAIYPDEGVAAVDEIVVPVGRPVSFRLTADTVMQSFLPSGLAGQIYLMPGPLQHHHPTLIPSGECDPSRPWAATTQAVCVVRLRHPELHHNPDSPSCASRIGNGARNRASSVTIELRQFAYPLVLSRFSRRQTDSFWLENGQITRERLNAAGWRD
ncbi:MAG: hypothetical protein AAFW98_09380, partial [Pseudomonadota bacterium]